MRESGREWGGGEKEREGGREGERERERERERENVYVCTAYVSCTV